MSLNVKQQWDYRLYETRNRRCKLLILNGVSYEWLSDIREDQLIRSEARPTEDSLIGEGQALLLLADHEPGWEDQVDYLALSNSQEAYHLYKLPHGLPAHRTQPRPIVSLPRMVSSSTFAQMGLSGLT